MTVECIHNFDTARHHIYVTRYRKAGDACLLHRHARWHLMECKKGCVTVELWKDENDKAMHEMDCESGYLEIPRGWWHRVTAREDGCLTACIFDLFDEQGRKLQDPKADFNPGTEVTE